ncbi:elongation factor P--(R)-beta-lysine ligase [Pasteurellaceae bacterium HPA106]|uniref:elongation factor P--(R)-beta-lysine ligase n=1 Tax=Spirabiliibacterium pneumoniae TaxID=221400 RepID=UPI001AAD726D|nr:elongation factor P--(R)-beta-lysine ligase [Spirabiliibacterium pneumoniae]MBE2896782.1 elongation factor P--(R)-beta-lysine ligase [Spirabiliibacterium pneumoniae]
MILQQQWQPSAPMKNILARAKLLAELRSFFTDRGLLEVETPILSEYAVTDVHLSVFESRYTAPFADGDKMLYLATSPEYHMKRLLAAGSGPIFQISKVFRNEESGAHHNPEFTMLEWYRPHFDMFRLINEVDDLLQQILDCKPAESVSYQFIFQECVGLDPLSAEKPHLVKKAQEHGLMDAENQSRDGLLQFLFTMLVEPKIGLECPVAVYHFPTTQAALAQISSEDHRVAERFEFYFKGLELANGFNELTDAQEQIQRFERDNKQRIALGLPERAIDQRFISALRNGMPQCSGVALGVDRLLMIALGEKEIRNVLTFNIENA